MPGRSCNTCGPCLGNGRLGVRVGPLVLEKFADHEELVPELISDTLKEDFDLKLYTDVNL